MYSRLSKKRSALLPTDTPLTQERVRRDLAWCVGSERFRNRDPLYHVTESFCENFDRIGRRRAAALAEESGSGFSEEERQRGGERQTQPRKEKDGRRRDAGGGGRADSPWTRFSEMTFQRGRLSASVLAGTGKMMLISCLEHTWGKKSSRRIQEQRVLGRDSQRRNVPGHDPDQMVFNRGFANSAVGLVVDTLRDARRTVDSMTRMAEGIGEMGEAEGGTLRAMYPFLDSSREDGLLAEYRDALDTSQDLRERAVLNGAIVKLEALRAKKAQMKNEFINKLRSVSERATDTLEDLERSGDEIWAAVSEAVNGAEADGGADGGQEGADAPDEAENRNGPADGAGTEPEQDGAEGAADGP